MGNRLLPCPYCGSGVAMAQTTQGIELNHLAVVCMKCGSRGAKADSEEEAYRLWNGRVSANTLTNGEHAVIQALIAAYNSFTGLPVMHPQHQMEFMLAIHAAQRLVLVRSVLRVMNEKP